MRRRSENCTEESAALAPLLADEEPSSLQVGTIDSPHWIEFEVHNRLTSVPGLHFSSLVIRRIQNGVCLEGVLESDEDDTDVCDVARSVAGVESVLNHLVVRRRRTVPPKG